MRPDPSKAWFEHYRDGHRVKMRPVGWKGWLALLALVALPLVIGLSGSRMFASYGPVATMGSLFTALAFVWMAAVVMIHYRSRPRALESQNQDIPEQD